MDPNVALILISTIDESILEFIGDCDLKNLFTNIFHESFQVCGIQLSFEIKMFRRAKKRQSDRRMGTNPILHL